MIKKKPFKVFSNIDVVSVEKNLVRISVLKNNFRKIACLQHVILLKVKFSVGFSENSRTAI